MADATTIRDEAYGRIPGLAALTAALDRANEPLAPLPAGERRSTDDAYKAAVSRGIAAVKGGDLIPSDVAHELHASEAAKQEDATRQRIRSEIIHTLTVEHEAALVSGVDDALAYLASALDVVVDAVTSTAPAIGGALTEADASRLGKRETTAWRKLVLLADTYEVIRETQAELVAHKLKFGSKKLVAQTGLYRDSINHVSYWLERRQAAARRSRLTAHSSAAISTVDWLESVDLEAGLDTGYPPTPAELTTPVRAIIVKPDPAPRHSSNTGDSWWPTPNHVMHLIDAATNDLLWLPDTITLSAAHEAALSTTTNIGPELTEEQETARGDYFRLTGAKDNTGIPAEYRTPAKSEVVNPWERTDPQFEKTLKAQRIRAQVRAARALS